MKLFMAVTGDQYELPIAVEENPEILARKMGVKKNLIYSNIANDRSGQTTGIKFVRVEIDEQGGNES